MILEHSEGIDAGARREVENEVRETCTNQTTRVLYMEFLLKYSLLNSV